jgi:hypothetical protein
MANITQGLTINIPHRPLWKQHKKRGADLCDCCKFKNRKKIDFAAIQMKDYVARGLAHCLTPLEYYPGCILPKICILKCPPKNGCDVWQPLWEKERQILEVMRQIEQAMKPRKRAKVAGQLELWERD